MRLEYDSANAGNNVSGEISPTKRIGRMASQPPLCVLCPWGTSISRRAMPIASIAIRNHVLRCWRKIFMRSFIHRSIAVWRKWSGVMSWDESALGEGCGDLLVDQIDAKVVLKEDD